MSSSSSVSLNSNRRGEIPTHCYCNPPLPLKKRTSWTRTNPARRFWTCPNSMCASKRCKAYWFIDEELTSEWYRQNLYELYHYLNGDQRELFSESMKNREMFATVSDEFEVYKSKKEEDIILLHMEMNTMKATCGLLKKCVMCLLFVVVLLVVCK